MQYETIIKLETTLDHLTGEELGSALKALNDCPEILDAIYLTGIGKKNRPCGLLQVLCAKENEERAAEEVFRHTHTLGLRRQEMERLVLPRFADKMELDGNVVPAKAYELAGETYLRPEADAVAEAAARNGTGAPALRIARIKK